MIAQQLSPSVLAFDLEVTQPRKRPKLERTPGMLGFT